MRVQIRSLQCFASPELALQRIHNRGNGTLIIFYCMRTPANFGEEFALMQHRQPARKQTFHTDVIVFIEIPQFLYAEFP
jgi:hypothetical protein